MLPVHIREMIRRDMPEVLSIESRAFDFPWREEEFIRSLRQRNRIGMVAESNQRIVGFMVYELHKNRLHILNLAVDYDFRKMSVGRQMIDKLKRKLSFVSFDRRARIMLELRETNVDGCMFVKSQGFRAVRIMRDFYKDIAEDAYLFQFKHEADEAKQVNPKRVGQ